MSGPHFRAEAEARPGRCETPGLVARRDFLRRLAAAGVVAASFDRARVWGVDAAEEARPPLTRFFGPRVAVEWMALLYDRVRAERLSPPVASRVYAYAGVTLYEAVVGGMPAHVSLAGQLNGLPAMPIAGQECHWEASAAAALAAVALGIAPWRAPDTRPAFEQLWRDQRTRLSRTGLPTRSREDSTTHGAAVGRAILGWAAADGFAATRSRPYTPPGGPGTWVPTPPAFAPALEPHWGTLRPFALDTPASCEPGPPPPYSEQSGSGFHREAARTYQAVSAPRTSG